MLLPGIKPACDNAAARRLAPLCALAFCSFALLNGCSGKPKPAITSTTSTKTAQPAMSAAARQAGITSAAQHPPFKLLLQKPDMPAILVVPENTTDDALKSLLWYLRLQVRDRHWNQLGLKPTTTVLGTPSYAAGSFALYRGDKCAHEMYSEANPCGPSIHKAATYHWGDSGDPAADSGDINGNFVFTASDGFQTEAEHQRDPDGKQHAASVARIHYATQQNARQTRQHTDVRFAAVTPAADSPNTTLRIASFGFTTPDAGSSFARQFLTLEGDHLCALGFTTLSLAPAGKPGKPFSIPCNAH